MFLKTRLMLSILGLPLMLLTLLAGVAVVLEDRQDRAALRETLSQGTRLLAPSLGEALAAGDERALSRLGERLMALPHVESLSVQDGHGELRLTLGQLGKPPTPPRDAAPQLLEQGLVWRWQTPLPSPGTATAWLTLDVDTTPLLLSRYRLMASAGLVLMLAGLLLLLVGFAVTRRVTQPLEDAGRALERLAFGMVPARLAPPASPELGSLTRRVNDLADHLAASRDDLQAQIEQATNELQESMETIEVQNIELDMAHRRAVEANRVKSEFLANMSHEIRTPLNGIVGFCRLLGRSRLEPRQREWLDHVQRACDNLLMLVNDVLDFSKLEAGRVELETLPLDMVALVDEVLGLQAPLAQHKHLRLLGLVFDDVPADLKGDPLRIRQVITNLVNNAVKFTDRGEVIVRVMLEEAETDRVLLRIGVSDTGMGLSEEACRRLFQAFHQTDISHSREFGGTGLGLAISRQLVEQMGGEVSVESVPGEGSTFSFTLPLEGNAEAERLPELRLQGDTVALDESHLPTRRALEHLMRRWDARVVTATQAAAEPGVALAVVALDAEDLEAASLDVWRRRLEQLACPALLLVNAGLPDLPALPLPHGGEILTKPVARATLVQAMRRHLAHTPQALPAPGSPRAPASMARLLVVDDTESNRLLMRELLSDVGVAVTLAASGSQALTLARQQRFDLVLMDIRMAGMDGLETTRALRRLGGEWRRVPIIAVTAHVQSEQRRTLLESGLDDVLIKPLEPQRLVRLLEETLGLTMPSRLTAEATTMQDDGRQNAGQELAVVDLEIGTRLAGGREALARELLERLADSLPESERAIRDAVERHDGEALLDALHALNGACRYCGTPRLGLLAETLETRLRSRGRESVVALLPELYAAMAELRRWQADQPSSTTKAMASASSSESER
ncbi:ATP-binding protein [Halomonas saccharevitans]|uniref:histidine kinase n=1 Tax=Halomonas saccharevitans TaxID=416872 RepID=A0A1I6X6K0_9GAMM|nr:ATP-binding protein [Halomonas saccharevitans]SFT33484.1 two-component system, NarL family, sensor histidine kinase BarA [Halomonas saccharevitans]